MSVNVLLGLTLLVLALIFVVQNTAAVEVRYLAWTVSLSRALLILTVLGVGVLIGCLVC